MKGKLPLYEIQIDEADGAFVEAIALVDRPAIESPFLAFNEDGKKIKFKIDEERKELLGGAMIPDMEIYRRDDDGLEYNVFFSKETIRQIAQVFMKKGFQENLNLFHSDVAAHAFVFQSYIVDSEMGINSPKGLDLPDGSWVIGTKITNDDVWNNVKEGKLKGFSVEGIFKLIHTPQKQKHNSEEEELLSLLKTFNALIEK